MVTEIYRGDALTFVFTLVDEAGGPISLVDATKVKFMAKESADLADSAAVFSVLGTVDAPASAGVCRAALTAAHTATAGRYKAEVQIKFSTGIILTAIQFDLVIKKDVVRSAT